MPGKKETGNQPAFLVQSPPAGIHFEVDGKVLSLTGKDSVELYQIITIVLAFKSVKDMLGDYAEKKVD